jgi:preprotein translocase subunit SecG
MQNVVLVIHLLLALGIIGIVLLQRSEGGGLGMGGGGGGGVMSSRGTATALSKVTWALGIAFIATSLTLTILAARDAATSSVMDAPAATAPVAPDGDEAAPPLPFDLPPTTGDAPIAPPPAD